MEDAREESDEPVQSDEREVDVVRAQDAVQRRQRLVHQRPQQHLHVAPENTINKQTNYSRHSLYVNLKGSRECFAYNESSFIENELNDILSYIAICRNKNNLYHFTFRL